MISTDHLAAPMLPSMGLLSEAQVRGQDCVFCGAMAAIDLGRQDAKCLDAVVSWFPRACRACAGGGYVDGLIAAACAACRDLPRPEQMLDLYLRLRHEVRRRLPIAQKAVQSADQGTLGWHAHQRIVDAAKDALLEPTGDDPSPLVLAMRCSELGRRLTDLTPYQPESVALTAARAEARRKTPARSQPPRGAPE
ncbi:DUF6415 family natural product biosynthesis protein [Streptomyces venezuelae]|uniref:DUF6415 family natural product biosynthesis protein n=1 Tax=Streptomyces venezuelae TaxID=54571 RepID=UPI00343B3B19